MNVSVECYAGRKAEERPVRFCLDERLFAIEEMIETWREPEYVFFKVRTKDGGIYILRHETSVPDCEWDVVEFRGPGPRE